MAERQEFFFGRTDRPDRRSSALLVGDVLALPAVQEGAPTVLVGGPALEAGVRWVHVSDSADVARLLDGGELLLTTGAAWPTGTAALRVLVAELAAIGVSGIVIELGPRMSRVPDAVIEACAAAGLALVALAVEVKFVAVTEAVHRALIEAQTAALRERQRLHDLFTALSLRGAPADLIVSEVARALDVPVHLENLAGEVVAVEALRVPVGQALRPPGPDGGDRVPVQARGVRWGWLIAADGPPHPAGRATVLELGATALAFGCLADGEGAWTVLAHRSLIEDLLGARFAREEDVEVRLRRLGLDLAGTTGTGLVFRTDEASDRLVARARAAGLAAVGSRRGADVVLLVATGVGALSDAAVRHLSGGAPAILGPSAEGVLGLLASTRAALDLAARPSGGDVPAVRRVADRPLERLVSALRDDRRLQAHSEQMLDPLVRHDRDRRGDLLAVLAALVAHPGNRSAAAAASHLSRSVFYQRLALIGDLLGADLDDGETLAALHLALLARRRDTTPPL
ncbi:PucR family transcriptional regulator [Microbacterium sp. Nx66]|nr:MULTISPECIES: PucR family transcriptional regulator ligand-binding domain-containing protein [unclassified Microbacterium]MDH5134571.1 PucR family transcriptional regulator ligand-binding domain-containing protein [Microbacterium sp. RD10]MDH5138125.1 PucR family transcriptional regulator ligand-binding domain-containing protein [Microbacterium sp. RD11]MDH5146263.1 PucR family transcriptional regulator ligand-binding domain-containing protein [Microbacterium sp. RD12]MDH5167656.1 PucR famil